MQLKLLKTLEKSYPYNANNLIRNKFSTPILNRSLSYTSKNINNKIMLNKNYFMLQYFFRPLSFSIFSGRKNFFIKKNNSKLQSEDVKPEELKYTINNLKNSDGYSVFGNSTVNKILDLAKNTNNLNDYNNFFINLTQPIIDKLDNFKTIELLEKNTMLELSPKINFLNKFLKDSNTQDIYLVLNNINGDFNKTTELLGNLDKSILNKIDLNDSIINKDDINTSKLENIKFLKLFKEKLPELFKDTDSSTICEILHLKNFNSDNSLKFIQTLNQDTIKILKDDLLNDFIANEDINLDKISNKLNKFIENKNFEKLHDKVSIERIFVLKDINLDSLDKDLMLIKSNNNLWNHLEKWDLINILENKTENLENLLKYLTDNVENITDINSREVSQILTKKDIDFDSVNNLLDNIKRKANIKKVDAKTASLALDFYMFQKNKNIDTLSLNEKRILLHNLIKRNIEIFQNKDITSIIPILPKNKQEYCHITSKLTEQIQLQLNTYINDDDSIEFHHLLDKIDDNLKLIDTDKIDFRLKYSRNEICYKIQDLLKTYKLKDINDILNLFNLKFKNNKLIGYAKNIENFKDIKINSTREVEIMNNLKPLIDNYLNNNNIFTDNLSIYNAFNRLIKLMPELFSQNDHNINQNLIINLKKLIDNESYKNLSENDKLIMKLSLLMENINNAETKKNNIKNSAVDAFDICKNFDLNKSSRLKLYRLIKNQNFIDDIKNDSKSSAKLRLISCDLKQDNTFKLAKILYNIKHPDLTEKNQAIFNHLEKNITELKKNDFVLPQTNLSKLNIPPSIKNIRGYNVKVFESEQIPNFYAYVHAMQTNYSNSSQVDLSIQLNNLKNFKSLDSDSILSVSYIGSNVFKTASENGLILILDPSHVYAGYNRDIFSTRLTKQSITDYYLFKNSQKSYGNIGENSDNLAAQSRKYISNLIKTKLKLTDIAYSHLVDHLSHTYSTKDLAENTPDILSKLIKIAKTNFLNWETYNEFLVSNPSIQGIFVNNIETCPEEYLKFAQDENLPIVIFSKSFK